MLTLSMLITYRTSDGGGVEGVSCNITKQVYIYRTTKTMRLNKIMSSKIIIRARLRIMEGPDCGNAYNLAKQCD